MQNHSIGWKNNADEHMIQENSLIIFHIGREI